MRKWKQGKPGVSCKSLLLLTPPGLRLGPRFAAPHRQLRLLPRGAARERYRRPRRGGRYRHLRPKLVPHSSPKSVPKLANCSECWGNTSCLRVTSGSRFWIPFESLWVCDREWETHGVYTCVPLYKLIGKFVVGSIINFGDGDILLSKNSALVHPMAFFKLIPSSTRQPSHTIRPFGAA